MEEATDKDIILFDGVCNLCNGFVNFIIDRDQQDRFRFGSLQSEEGEELIKKYQVPTGSLESVVLISDGKYYLKSSAALAVLVRLGGLWKSMSIFYIIPRFIRDWVYDKIAASRYKLFGRTDQCRMPTPELKAKFIS